MHQTQSDEKAIQPFSWYTRVLDFLRNTGPRNLWLPLGILVVGSIITIFAALYVKAEVETAAQKEFDFICSEIQLNIADRLASSA